MIFWGSLGAVICSLVCSIILIIKGGRRTPPASPEKRLLSSFEKLWQSGAYDIGTLKKATYDELCWLMEATSFFDKEDNFHSENENQKIAGARIKYELILRKVQNLSKESETEKALKIYKDLCQ
jgi:hypothetical protein